MKQNRCFQDFLCLHHQDEKSFSTKKRQYREKKTTDMKLCGMIDVFGRILKE
jgi:energy-converting hydrogenase A subunit M